MKNKFSKFQWIPSVLLMILIFWVSSLPAYKVPYFDAWEYIVKKGSHFIVYGLLALFNLIWINKNTRKTRILSFFLCCYLQSQMNFINYLLKGEWVRSQM